MLQRDRVQSGAVVLRGMMWADNCWLFCDGKERLICIVNDIIEDLSRGNVKS